MPLPFLLFVIAGILVAPGLLRETTDDVQAWTTKAMEEADDPEPDDDVVEVSILRLKNARYRRGRPLPGWIQDLDGKRIRLWGYMAIGTLEGLEQFELVPESCECGQSKVNHFVEVSLTEGVTRFIPGRITLEGVFHCGEEVEDGFITSVFRLKTPYLPN
ncbi:MAG: hypothetical protein AAGA20_20710 [Planctomycetota bacterium]